MKRTCLCGKGSVEFRIVGEDLYDAKLINSNVRKDKDNGEAVFSCITCGLRITEADLAMINYIEL